MACGLTEHCCFYQLHKSCDGDRNWDFLITGYCEGAYDWLCCRRRYFDKTGSIAPAEVNPVDVLPPEMVAAPALNADCCLHLR